MNKIILTGFLLASTIGATGCATIVKGTSQTVTVDTRPPGATCTLTREGETIAVVNPTPGSVQVHKDKDAITLLCEKEEYQESVGVMESKFQSMTFGNIIFGGIIGVAVDAGTGAMNEYPPLVTVSLIPFEFDTSSSKDEFFDKMRDEFLVQSAMVMERISERCDEDMCSKQLQSAVDEKEAKLVEIENKRSAARVRGS